MAGWDTPDVNWGSNIKRSADRDPARCSAARVTHCVAYVPSIRTALKAPND